MEMTDVYETLKWLAEWRMIIDTASIPFTIVLLGIFLVYLNKKYNVTLKDIFKSYTDIYYNKSENKDEKDESR